MSSWYRCFKLFLVAVDSVHSNEVQKKLTSSLQELYGNSIAFDVKVHSFGKGGKLKWGQLENQGFFIEEDKAWLLSGAPEPFAVLQDMSTIKFSNYNGRNRTYQRIWLNSIHLTRIVAFSGTP